MKPSSDICLGHERLSSSNASDIKTATVPKGTSHIDLQAETTNAGVTFDGSDPSLANAPRLIVLAAQMPLFRPLGQGITIKHVSTAGTPSVLQLAYYR